MVALCLNWETCVQAAGMLFLQQVSTKPGKAAWGIHPITQEVRKLGNPAVLFAAVQALQQVCVLDFSRVELKGRPGVDLAIVGVLRRF